jgi:hypothetical protein
MTKRLLCVTKIMLLLPVIYDDELCTVLHGDANSVTGAPVTY